MYARWKQIEFFAPILTIYRQVSKVRIFDTKIGHFQNNNVSFIMNKHSSSKKTTFDKFETVFIFLKGSLKGSFTFSQEYFQSCPMVARRAFPPLSRPPGRQAHTTLSYHPTLIQYLKSADGVFCFIYSLHFVFFSLLSLILDEQKSPNLMALVSSMFTMKNA